MCLLETLSCVFVVCTPWADREAAARFRAADSTSLAHGARARAFVYYFNTERNAVYCVLYVFLFILYNTVFFITQPWSRSDDLGENSALGRMALHVSK